VEFEKKILTGGIFFKNWGHFFKIGGNGANVLVEFEKKNLTGGIFLKNWGHFFQNWGQKIILGSRKSAFLGILLTPESEKFEVSTF